MNYARAAAVRHSTYYQYPQNFPERSWLSESEKAYRAELDSSNVVEIYGEFFSAAEALYFLDRDAYLRGLDRYLVSCGEASLGDVLENERAEALEGQYRAELDEYNPIEVAGVRLSAARVLQQLNPERYDDGLALHCADESPVD